jgi:uncharacterized protein YndB with AHSA1/START domain
MTDFASVVAEVRVKAAPERAFTIFTANIGEWWPVASNSVYQGTVAFEGDELVERSGDKVAVWAEVTRWDPPAALGLSWHAGHDSSRTTDILVTFTRQGDETLVHLTHTAWERLLNGEEQARDYAQGWPPVLNHYAEMFG